MAADVNRKMKVVRQGCVYRPKYSHILPPPNTLTPSAEEGKLCSELKETMSTTSSQLTNKFKPTHTKKEKAKSRQGAFQR